MTKRMNRTELTSRLVELSNGDVAIIAGIGNAGFDLHAVGHRPANFYMLGSMGQAVPIGLGLALARPDLEVVVAEGDGSVLMNLSSLVTVGSLAPPNLTIIVWDNAAWQITGGQRLATAETCDLATVARGCGIAQASTPADEDAFTSGIRYALDAPGPHFVVAKIDLSPPAGRYHDEPVRIKHQFMDAIGTSHHYP